MKATDKVLSWTATQEIIHNSLVLVTRERSTPYDQWVASRNRVVRQALEKFCREATMLAMTKPGPKPAIGYKGWKADFCNMAVDRAIENGIEWLQHDTYIGIVDRCPQAVRSDWVFLSLMKITAVTAPCAMMVVHGYDPDLLLMSREEVLAAVRKAA